VGKHTVDDDDQAMPLLLTKRQAGQWAQVSDYKMDEWMEEPDFPAIRSSRHVRVHARLFEQWLARKAGR